MRSWLMLIATSLMTLAISCEWEQPTGPLNPDEDIKKIEPTAQMRQAWDEVAECIKFPWPSLFDEISFYRVGDSVQFACRELEGGCLDLFSSGTKSVYFSGGKIDQQDMILFKHAFGHFMLRDKNHESSAWERCGLMKDSWAKRYSEVLF